MRRQLRSIFSEFLNPLNVRFLISHISFIQILRFSSQPISYITGSIIFLDSLVRQTLLIFPCSSGSIGSSGENLHSPSTINLYLHRYLKTGAHPQKVAILNQNYNSNRKLFSLLLKCYRLLPLEKRTSKQYRISSIIPSKSLPYIRILQILFLYRRFRIFLLPLITMLVPR